MWPVPTPPVPPPLPPPPPAHNHSLVTGNSSYSSQRRQKEQDYWERAFQSLGGVTPPVLPPHTTTDPSAAATAATSTAEAHHPSATATAISSNMLLDNNAQVSHYNISNSNINNTINNSTYSTNNITDQSTSNSSMDTSTNTKLSTIYYQTKNTRRAHNTTTMHNIDNSTTELINNTHIGSFDTENNINSTFLASRNDSTHNIHQNISLSFDPKDMTCISCSTPHNITHPAPDTPVTYVLSDQNFPGNCGGGEGLCIRTIRVEDGQLTEITDLFLELMAGVGMGSSNIILLGSASAIATSGSSGYVFEWIGCAKKISSRWPNVKVCPLVPLWGEGVPGQFLRSVQEIGSVFRSLHGNDPRGLNGSWISLNDFISNELCSSCGSVPDRYSLPYPSSLSGPPLVKNRTFVSNQRSPVTAPALSCKVKSLVVRCLAEELNASLSAGIDPGVIAERVASAGGAANAKDVNSSPPPPFKLVVTGSSHMSRTIPHLLAKGIEVVDLTERCWHLNSKSMAAITARIRETDLDSLSVLVHDLFGNTSVRFRQADDTLSLAIKLPGEGGWHLLGDAVFTPDTILREQVKLVSILESTAKNRGKIFIPPIPRFVFGSCCTSESHGSNTRSDTHSAYALTEHIRQRHTIIKALHNNGITNFKVIDIMHSIRDGPDTEDNRLTCLKKITAGDNVHLTPDGYAKIAAEIADAAQQLTTRPAVRVGPPRGVEIPGWHGFVSTTGYGSTSRSAPPPPSRGRGMRHHPYRRF